MGRKFIIKTDHRPLVKLLGCHESVPSLASTRIKKWAMMLAAYDYELQYFAGSENVYADFLSRQPLTNVALSENETVEVQILLIQDDTTVKAETVRSETGKDPVLTEVRRYVRDGWPMTVTENVKPFYLKRLELSIEDDILLWNDRVVVPTSLRMVLLHKLHAEHFGMVKMKQLARRYLWWPNIDQEIECTVRACVRCQENARSPSSKTGIGD